MVSSSAELVRLAVAEQDYTDASYGEQDTQAAGERVVHSCYVYAQLLVCVHTGAVEVYSVSAHRSCAIVLHGLCWPMNVAAPAPSAQQATLATH